MGILIAKAFVMFYVLTLTLVGYAVMPWLAMLVMTWGAFWYGMVSEGDGR